MRDVKIFVEGLPLDLFDDEQIILESSVQNVQDISKVFSDFSQSFTVPCTPNNNSISEFFYDYDLNGVIDHNIRRLSFIEIDGIPFRTGKIQLEKVNLKDGLTQSYTYSFYGSIVSLKDKFGDDKLKDLDFSPYTHSYTGTEIENRIKGSTDYDVRYPLISSDRVWQYNNLSTPNANIDTTLGAIQYNELFPALKVARIFDAIETKYGIDFQGNFLTDPKFTNLFLLFSNSETLTYFTDAVPLDFISKTGYSSVASIITDSFLVQYFANDPITNVPIQSGSHTVIFNISGVSNTTIPYVVDVYSNGVLVDSLSGISNQSFTVSTESNVPGLNKTYTYKVRSQGALTLTVTANYKIVLNDINNLTAVRTATMTSSATVIPANLNLNQYVPDMTVSEFVQGVFKQFNLTAYGIDSSTFLIEPLEDFYLRGNIIDITENVTLENIDIERVPLYKRISFKRQPCDSFMNIKYKESFGREFGDLMQEFNYDAGEYTVELPFSNLLFNKLDLTEIQVGYKLNSNFNAINTKPILLYLYEVKSGVSFYLKKGSTTVNITSYAVFGQDVKNNTDYSLNFGNDQSSYLETVVTSGAYNTYYQPYLQNLFNLKTRITYVKCMFSIQKMLLKLNDRVIIRDHRFIINNMSINMTTGEVDLVLINDYRRLKSRQIVNIKPTGGIIRYSFPMGNNTKSMTVSDPNGTGFGFSSTYFTSDGNLDVTVPASPTFRLLDENNTDKILTENDEYIVTEDSSSDKVISFTVTHEYLDGTTEDEIIYLQYAE